MHTKTCRRSAFIAAVGLLAFYTCPATACDAASCGRIVLAQNADPQARSDATATAEAAVADTERRIKKKSRHVQRLQRSRSGKSEKVASKSSKTSDGEKTTEQSTKSGDEKSAVSSSVADANAQMLGTTKAAAKTADELGKSLPEKTRFTDGAAVPVDDRAQSADTTAAQTSTPGADLRVVASDQLNDLDRAATDAAPAPTFFKAIIEPAASMSASSSTDDSWNQASLIGKIFIAFGGFLTLASAARMFMA